MHDGMIMKIPIALISTMMVFIAVAFSSPALGQMNIKGPVSGFQWEFDENACSVLVGKKLIVQVDSFEGKPALLCQQLNQLSMTSGNLDVNEITIPAQIVIRSAVNPQRVTKIIDLPVGEIQTAPETDVQPSKPRPKDENITEIDLFPAPAQ